MQEEFNKADKIPYIYITLLLMIQSESIAYDTDNWFTGGSLYFYNNRISVAS